MLPGSRWSTSARLLSSDSTFATSPVRLSLCSWTHFLALPVASDGESCPGHGETVVGVITEKAAATSG